MRRTVLGQLTETQVWEFPGTGGAVVGHNLTLQAGEIVEIIGHLRGSQVLACELPGHPGLILGVTCRVLRCDEELPASLADDSRDERSGRGMATARHSRCGTDGLSPRQRELLDRVESAGINGLVVSAADIRVGRKLMALKRVERVPERRSWTLRVKPQIVKTERIREAS